MNQCCSDYRLFCKTKHIATSDILDKPLISFNRIMSPVLPRKHEVSPSCLSPVFLFFVVCFFIIIVILFFFLHFPLSGPVLSYISLLIIPCMIVYVTNNKEP